MADDLPLSPNEKLSELIVEKLLKENLIPEKKIEEIKNRIAEGTTKPEDWRYWIEDALPKPMQESGDEQTD